ncbi:MAG: hypothetical protein CMI54_04870 [Parcubacteria group bacterium]|nr:hypothetical protein [Parcubacteria group bacterium]|tara:strand:+ start:12781 stop:13332 length:552 start_codon:yes stop_codon:yes gene_type:complete
MSKINVPQIRTLLEHEKETELLKSLFKYYRECQERIRRFEITGSSHYECSFKQIHLNWFKSLLDAWNAIDYKFKLLPFLRQINSESPEKRYLELLGFNASDISSVKLSLEILTLNDETLISDEKLIQLAIYCKQISRCSLCEHGHFTTNYSSGEETFWGCRENPKVIEQIYGDCDFYEKGVEE